MTLRQKKGRKKLRRCGRDSNPQSLPGSRKGETGKQRVDHYATTHVAASFLPSVLVPLTGLVFPAVAMAFMLLYMERDDIG